MSQSDNVKISKSVFQIGACSPNQCNFCSPHTKYISRQKPGGCEAAFGADLATAVRDKGFWLQGFSNMQQLLQQELTRGGKSGLKQLLGSDGLVNVVVR